LFRRELIESFNVAWMTAPGARLAGAAAALSGVRDGSALGRAGAGRVFGRVGVLGFVAAGAGVAGSGARVSAEGRSLSGADAVSVGASCRSRFTLSAADDWRSPLPQATAAVTVRAMSIDLFMQHLSIR
jgi:hypothetical protein